MDSYFVPLQFFDHPIILDLMKARWYGGSDFVNASRTWWFFLNVWCLFDVVLFPLSFIFAFIAGNIKIRYLHSIYIYLVQFI